MEIQPKMRQGTKSGKRTNASTESFEDAIGASHLREPFNRKAALYLLEHADTVGLIDDDKAYLHALLRKAGKHDFLQSEYTKAYKDKNGKGRWHVHGIGLQRMNKKLRATLCKGLWLDLDFVNCGPTLLLNLCKKLLMNKDDYECLVDYVTNREERLKTGVTNATRDEVKAVVIAIMYGKQLSNFQKGTQKLSSIKWLSDLEKELRGIRKSLAYNDAYEEIRSQYKNA